MFGWGREGYRITASPDLNTLFPASANHFATKINERAQISGMVIVLSGPDAALHSRPEVLAALVLANYPFLTLGTR